jgi:para-nitrobenzyl esterase
MGLEIVEPTHAVEGITDDQQRRFPSPFIAYRTVVADSDSVCPAITADYELSRRIPVYAWQNDDASMPPRFFPQFLDPTKPWGAYHIAADPFLFPNPSITLSPDQTALAQQFTAEAVGYSAAVIPPRRAHRCGPGSAGAITGDSRAAVAGLITAGTT